MTTRKIAILAVCSTLGLCLAGSAFGEAPKAEPKKDPAAPAKAEEKKPAEAPKTEAKDATAKDGAGKPAVDPVVDLLQQAKTKVQAQPADAAGHRAKAIKSITDAISEVNLANAAPTPPKAEDKKPAAAAPVPTEGPKAK